MAENRALLSQDEIDALVSFLTMKETVGNEVLDQQSIDRLVKVLSEQKNEKEEVKETEAGRFLGNAILSVEQDIAVQREQCTLLYEKGIKKYFGLGCIQLICNSTNIDSMCEVFKSSEYFFRDLRFYIKREYDFNGLVIDNIENVHDVFRVVGNIVGKNVYNVERKVFSQGDNVPKKIAEISSEFNFVYELKNTIILQLLNVDRNWNLYSRFIYGIFIIFAYVCILTVVISIKYGKFILNFDVLALLLVLVIFLEVKSCLLEVKKLKERHKVNFISFFEDHLVYTNQYITVSVKYEDILGIKIIKNPLQKKYNFCTFSINAKNVFRKNENIGSGNFELECIEFSDEKINQLKLFLKQ